MHSLLVLVELQRRFVKAKEEQRDMPQCRTKIQASQPVDVCCGISARNRLWCSKVGRQSHALARERSILWTCRQGFFRQNLITMRASQ
jgi:hypothetical protein